MKWAVIITGALAVLALVFADVIGFFAFLPLVGLLLLAPSLFLYLLAIWGVSALLPIRRLWLARAAALVIVVGLASFAVLPPRLAAIAEYDRRAALRDIAPPARIALAGDVRIEGSAIAEYWQCDALCLAVLDMPGVRSVTISSQEGAWTFQLVPRAAADPVAVVSSHYPGWFVLWGGVGGDSEALAAWWRARLAGPDRLVRSAPATRADYTLQPGADTILRGSEVIARRTIVSAQVPIIPPFLFPSSLPTDADFTTGGLTLAMA